MDEITQRRFANPDYELELKITGVRIGTTGKTRWHIERDNTYEPEVAAEILDRAAKVLRGDCEDLKRDD